jgi:hypothetical protein
MQQGTTFSSWTNTLATDSTLPKSYPQLRWATPNATSGNSIWVIGTGQTVTYFVPNAGQVAGVAVTLPAPTFTGGTPSATPTVKVLDAFGRDITSYALAGALPVGTYSLITTLNDGTYAIASTGNTNGVLTITPPPVVVQPPVGPSPVVPPVVVRPVVTPPVGGGGGTSTGADQAIANAASTAQTLSFPTPQLPGGGTRGDTRNFSNVANVPAGFNNPFGPDAVLAVISAPSGDEANQVISLTDAKKMLRGGSSNSSTGASSGAAATGEREVRVPVSRNSLAEIVNGGVRLPSGVEQQLFVVKGN